MDIANKLAQSVQEFHAIKIAATELMDIHLTRCAIEGLEIPFVDQTFVRACFNLVTTGKETVHASELLVSTRNTYMQFGDADKFSRAGFDQLFNASAKELITGFNNNLYMHSHEHIWKTLKCLHPPPSSSTKKERKQHAIFLKRTAMLLFKQDIPSDISDECKTLVLHYKTRLGLMNLPMNIPFSPSCSGNQVNATQTLLFRAMVKLNGIRESYVPPEGSYWMKPYATCPVTTKLVPQCVTLDHRAICDILDARHGISHSTSDTKRLQTRIAALKRSAKARSLKVKQCLEMKPVDRTKPSHAVIAQYNPKKRKHDDEETVARKELQAAAATKIKAMWKGFLARKFYNTLSPLHPALAVLMVRKIEKFILAKKKTHFKTAISKILADERQDDLGDIFNMHHFMKIGPKNYDAIKSIRFDGFKVVVMYHMPKPKKAVNQAPTTGKRKRKNDKPLPTPGRLYCTTDIVKNLQFEDYFQLVGLDPGREEIARIVDPTHEVRTHHPNTGKRTSKKFNTVVYRSRKRRADLNVAQHQKLMEAELTTEIKEATSALSNFSRKSSNMEIKLGYFHTRRTRLLPVALPHYGHIKYRQRNFRKYGWTQKSEANFIKQVKKLAIGNRKIAIAWGMGSRGHAGMPGCKGRPPCPGVGLARKIAKHIVVILTPEPYTSKTCSVCGSECSSDACCDKKYRQHLRKKKGPRLHDRAERRKVMRNINRRDNRSIRRCNNENCRAHLHRDYNAAINIQRNCLRLLHNQALEMDEEDREMADLVDECD